MRGLVCAVPRAYRAVKDEPGEVVGVEVLGPRGRREAAHFRSVLQRVLGAPPRQKTRRELLVLVLVLDELVVAKHEEWKEHAAELGLVVLEGPGNPVFEAGVALGIQKRFLRAILRHGGDQLLAGMAPAWRLHRHRV